MPARLLIRPEDCSPLGQEILAYMKATGISMNKLAELSGVPQPRLRGACFKGTCPTPETLRKLSRAMNRHHLELYTLAYEGRIDTITDNEADISLDLLMKEIFELAREMNLAPPKARPSRQELAEALQILGFKAKTKLKNVKTQ